MTLTEDTIRQTIRQLRHGISYQKQYQSAALLAKHITSSPQFMRSHNIACYLASNGEMNLQPVMKRLWDMGKNCYLPVIDPLNNNRLRFVHYKKGDSLSKNRFGILEPSGTPTRRIPPWALDLVMLPLVAFDGKGNRLGMGGGYYDRTFAYLLQRRCWYAPHLVGIAYDFQKVEMLHAKQWDIPLDSAVTESGVSLFRPT